MLEYRIAVIGFLAIIITVASICDAVVKIKKNKEKFCDRKHCTCNKSETEQLNS